MLRDEQFYRFRIADGLWDLRVQASSDLQGLQALCEMSLNSWILEVLGLYGLGSADGKTSGFQVCGFR